MIARLRDPRDMGECARFPGQWVDRLWGLDDPDDVDQDSRARSELRRAGVRICEQCPVRAQCLAFALTTREQYGLFGGLPLKARRIVIRFAKAAGIPVEKRRD